MDLITGIDYKGSFEEICNDSRSAQFMDIVNDLKCVEWRVNIDTMTENEIILCTMFEKNMSCEANIKGSMLMYCKSGPIYRQLFKTMAGIYRSYGTR